MEHQPDSRREPERRPVTSTEQLLRELPNPHEAAGVITALLSDKTREDYFNALSESRDIDQATARAIAYNLIAHAPKNADIAAMETLLATGDGRYDELRREYLPLYQHPDMPAEGRLLLDALGTYLFHQEHPDTLARGGHLPYVLDGGLFYTDNGQGERVAVAFQLPMGLAAHDAAGVADYLERYVRSEGDAFRAFLRLPGIDATSPGLIPYFRAVHLRTPQEVHAAQQRARMRPVPGATPDWETVEIGGQIHDFSR